MKNNFIISFILSLFCICSYAQQQPAIISIEGFGGEKDDGLYIPITKTPDNGFIFPYGSTSVTGQFKTSCPPDSKGWTVFKKYDESGTILEWEKCHISQQPDSSYYYMFQTNNNHFILGGTGNTGPLKRHWRMRKEDANGNILWSKAFGGSRDDLLDGMIATTDGGYIMYGESYSSDGDVGFHYGTDPFQADLWVLKLDSDGNILWSKVVGGSNMEQAGGIAPAPDGGCYIGGGSLSTDFDCVGNHGVADVLVARIDGAGNLKWSRCLGGLDFDIGRAVAQDNNGGVLIAANTESSSGDVHNHIGKDDFWVINIDSDNNLLWENCYGSSMDGEAPYAISKSTDGSIWIGGFSFEKFDTHVDTSYGNSDAWVVHTDANGNFINARVMGSYGPDQINILHPLPGGVMLAGGFYEGAGPAGGEFPTISYGGRDILLVKLAPWTTGISDNNISAKGSVYPNPATDLININNKGYDILINDITGKEKYKTTKANSTAQIDISNWPRGMYYVQMISDNGTKQVEKLQLQ